VLAQAKASYFQLAFLSKTLAILESDGELLKQVEQAADARYRSGKGMQQDVLQAQLQKTKLVREIAMPPSGGWETRSPVEAVPQQAPGFAGHRACRSHGNSSLAELSGASRAGKAQNPELAASQKIIDKQSLQVDLRAQDFLS